MSQKTILVVSDIHYACEAEQARRGFETRTTANKSVQLLIRFYRDYFWLRNPTEHNHLLDQFFLLAGEPDLVVANGDFSCDSAFIGVADDAACQSARECLEKLRKRFAPRFSATFGDHELGKVSLVGNQGGLRFRSWQRAQDELQLNPFWQLEIRQYVLIGITSTLVALPVFEPETLLEEREAWRAARERHMEQIRAAFAKVQPKQKILLFCHDPTALPFLWREEIVRGKVPQVEHTIIGHLHSPVFMWKSRMLAGMPVIRGFGNTARRYSEALHEARHWREFNVKLCPSLHGIELLKDGGFLKIWLDDTAATPPKIECCRIIR